jgi:hypothetical protein
VPFPAGKTAMAWNWPLTCIYGPNYKWSIHPLWHISSCHNQRQFSVYLWGKCFIIQQCMWFGLILSW